MYYPKSQITPNLYTNGGDFVLSTDNSDYTGYYFKISTGKYFTGRNQNDRPNIELVPITSLSQDNITPPNSNLNISVLSLDNSDFLSTQYEVNTGDVFNYSILSNINVYNPPKTLIPYYNPQQPTQQDYQNGEFRRFFCKKTNEIIYIEIDVTQYNKLISKNSEILWQLYLPYNVTWQLTGDKQQVAQVNKNMVELASKNLKLPYFNLYLKEDYTKYYQ